MAELFPQYGYGNLPYKPGGAPSGGVSMPMFGAGTPGSNQYMMNNPAAMSMPGNTSMSTPGIVPPAPGGAPPPTTDNPYAKAGTVIGGKHQLGGGNIAVPTFDPQFTQQFYQWLQSMLGKGATPFDLSAILPSTGQATAPGTLTAPL